MKLEPNHIDEIFRHRLHDAEVPPPAFVWPNVEQALQKRKRRRFFLWLFAFGITTAGLWALLHTRDAAAPPDVAGAQQHRSSGPTAPAPGDALRPAAESATNRPAAAAPGTRPAQGASQPANNSTQAAKAGTVKSPEIAQPAPLPDAGAPAPGLMESAPMLATGAPEPLAFARKTQLPNARPFIRKKKDTQYCYDFAQNPNVWMIDAYVGPSFNKRTYEATSPDFENYADMRRSTETTDWSFNAGVRGSLLLGRHFIVRTGLHYEQMTEVFEYADPNYVKYIVEITQTIIDNKPVIVIDTVGVQYGENYTKTYNRYGLLDVPLEIGGELRRGRLGLSLHGGVSFNVLFWKRGTVLSPDGQPVPFTPGERGATEIFRDRTGWSAGGSAQVFFHLHPTVRLFAEPYYRKVLKPVTLDDQTVEQRRSNWGIKIGMTKILD
jgi:hypothetical protein